MRFIALSIALLALGLTGCPGKCRQLSERLCACATTTSAREDCKRRAASADGLYRPTADQEAFCATKLEAVEDGCDCRNIDTPAGKVACGLAREKEDP